MTYTGRSRTGGDYLFEALIENGVDHPFSWTSSSLPALAEGFGCRGESVADADALATAVDRALAHDGPSLIDVDVPTDEPSAAAAVEFETAIDPTRY